MIRSLLALALLTALPVLPVLPASAATCSMCEAWNAPQAPFRVYGNTWYVGPKGLSSVLITSPQGHILIDGALPESAARIAASIKALGFRIEDIKLIVNSHAHNDHAGGIAELQRLSGADVAAASWAAAAMCNGQALADDPQIGESDPWPAVKQVRVVKDGESLHVGPLTITMHSSVGHTPGGASWSWHACHDGACKRIMYADSMSAVSNDTYKYGAHPEMQKGFEASAVMLEKAGCDILINTHPADSLFEAAAKRDPKAFLDKNACKRQASWAREAIAERLAKEKAQH